ncbi:MAG: pyridoxamine 5'-phosphate oxidase family protein [Terracidiphilus sp.]|jgi:pyridoxine/pyridoxamine 5'-phosphate oxidase
MDKAAIYAFMARIRLGVLSSMSSDGVPQSALVGIVTTPELEIVFDAKASSRKYANLVARPSCSFVVGWEGEQTVQFEGVAFLSSGDELKHYLKTYFAIWPGAEARVNTPGIVYFAVRPTWIRYSDFDQRPPLIQEITF